jgi:ubiquinol-cytochrome c reductase cytochrome b subunit
MMAFVANPKHDRFYKSRNDRMPAFGEEKMLTEQEIGLVVDWLRGEWYEPTVTPPEVRSVRHAAGN